MELGGSIFSGKNGSVFSGNFHQFLYLHINGHGLLEGEPIRGIVEFSEVELYPREIGQLAKIYDISRDRIYNHHY